jgi:hypothetical protein
MAGAGNSQNIEPTKPAMWVVVDDNSHGYTRVTANTTHFVQVGLAPARARREDIVGEAGGVEVAALWLHRG